MAVHSICPGQYQTASSAGFVNFCLIAVGRFGSCFSISCNESSWTLWEVSSDYFRLEKGQQIRAVERAGGPS